MFSRLCCMSFVAVMLVSFIGCDPGAGGPGVTITKDSPGGGPKPGEKFVPKGKTKTVEGPQPTSAQ